MLCQNCKINESTIHLYTNVNGRQQQVDLCQNCYKIMKTDPNNSFLKGMTQRSQLTGDPFEDFFNNLGNFQSPQEPQTLQLNPEAVMEVAATAKTITVVVVKTLVKHALKSQRTVRRVRHQCHRDCPQRGY